MTVTLPPELESYVAEQVRLGVYKTPEECITTALRVSQQDRADFERLKQEIAKGMATLPDRTPGFSAAELMDQVRLKRQRCASN